MERISASPFCPKWDCESCECKNISLEICIICYPPTSILLNLELDSEQRCVGVEGVLKDTSNTGQSRKAIEIMLLNIALSSYLYTMKIIKISVDGVRNEIC